MSQLVKGLLTIGIPTYNGGFNLPDMFSSIQKLGLNETEYQILVVDNCSDDNTDIIIQQYKAKIPNLKYYKNSENIGRIENWNKVIDLAEGDYLIIMNVNDRFIDFEAPKYIRYLDNNPQIPMILTDIQFEDHMYPNWIEYGLVNLEEYLKKTFLDPDYLEFHSIGLLHQHIFRTKVIMDNNIRFDVKIPRTTDRVFAGEVVKTGGGIFYYMNKSMVSWHLNKNRYHYNVHSNHKSFNFSELWMNEYEANVQLAEIGNISYKEVLQSQLILAGFFMHIKKLRALKNKILRSKTPTKGMEIPTAAIYYAYVKTMAESNKVSINYSYVKATALWRVIRWYLRSLHLYKKKERLLGDIIKTVEII